MVAGNVPPSEVAKALGHEIIGHKGLRAVFGENFDALLDLVYKDHVKEINDYAALYRRNPKNNVDDQRYLTEEFLADCADAEVKPSWWKELIAKIRMWLRNYLPNLNFSSKDIEGVISMAARRIRRSTDGYGNVRTGTDLADGNTGSTGNTATGAAGLRFMAEPFSEQQKRALLGVNGAGKVLRSILYGGSLTRNGNTVKFDGRNSHSLKLHLEAPGISPKKGFVTVEEVEKYLPLALAQKPVADTKLNKRNRKKTNKKYRITDNKVRYTLVTSWNGYFRSFYSNKKTPGEVNSQKAGSASSPEQTNTIPQNSENANNFRFSVSGDGTDFNGNVRNATELNGQKLDNFRFLLAEFSEADRRDITLILKPFVGFALDHEDRIYKEYLAQKGIAVSEKDAHAFAVFAMQENKLDRNKRTAQRREKARLENIRRRDQYLYDNFPFYREAVEFAGSHDFKIKPSGKFRGEEFSGSFIAPEFVKYSGEKAAKNSGKLDAAQGVNSDELAAKLARSWGRDALEVEQEIKTCNCTFRKLFRFSVTTGSFTLVICKIL